MLHRERLAAAQREVVRIETISRIALPAGFVLTWVFVITLMAIASALIG